MSDKGYLFLRQVDGRPDVFEGEIRHGRIHAQAYLIPITDDRGGKITRHYDLKIWNDHIQDWDAVGGAKWKPMSAGGTYLLVWADETDLDLRHWFGAFANDEQPKDAPKDTPWNYTLRFQSTVKRSEMLARGRSKASSQPQAVGGPVNDCIPY